MKERTAELSAALADELRNIVIQAEALLQAIAEDKNEAVGVLRERAQSAVSTAKTRLAEAEKQATAMAQRASVTAQAYVRENPWTVLGGAVATGLVLGAAFMGSLGSRRDAAG